jgi:putative intracellular protease/amidase
VNNLHTVIRNLSIVATLALLGEVLVPAGHSQESAKPRPQPVNAKRNVAIVIHEGVELLDFAGPGEVFAAADRSRAFNVYTVGETAKPITSQRFLSINPQYTIANCPKPDLVVIPGGATRVLLESPTMLAWVKAAAKDSEVVLSVCTGAFVLAQVGLLDGQEATTHHASLDRLAKQFPMVKVRSDRRVVDNGKVVTTAGVSAGIDGALHVVSRLCGQDVARGTAMYMEYRWEPAKDAPPAAPALPRQGDKGKEPPKVDTNNANTLLKAHRTNLKVTASSFWTGWEPEKAIDGNVETSWFSARGDAAARGTKPWIMITFPQDVLVTRVTIVGNREPAWFDGYTILTGMVEFLDAGGKQIWVDENEGVGNRRDFEFKPEKPVAKVRSVKFVSLKDQGDQNPYDDIAIAEFLIE